MKFKDPQLQRCHERNVAGTDNDSTDLHEVHALIDTHDSLVKLEGIHSLRVHETIDRLLSAKLRPALRRWYGPTAVEMNSTAIEFRNQLSRLTGEKLENIAKMSPDAS